MSYKPRGYHNPINEYKHTYREGIYLVNKSFFEACTIRSSDESVNCFKSHDKWETFIAKLQIEVVEKEEMYKGKER